MAKVYIVMEGHYSDRHIERVFSTMELAEEFCDRHDDEYSIEEYEMDADMPPRKTMCFRVSLDLENQNLIEVTIVDRGYRNIVHMETERVSTYVEDRCCLDFFIETDSKARAVRIAHERFGEVIASEQVKFPYLRAGIIKRHGDLEAPYYDFITGEIVLDGEGRPASSLPGFVTARKLVLEK